MADTDGTRLGILMAVPFPSLERHFGKPYSCAVVSVRYVSFNVKLTQIFLNSSQLSRLSKFSGDLLHLYFGVTGIGAIGVNKTYVISKEF